jgi:hypothetical protein
MRWPRLRHRPAPTSFAPHCDPRVLHAPGECSYCDMHADWQALRGLWGIAFTGHEPQRTDAGVELPCPADLNRPPTTDSDHRRWGGNVARPARAET